MAGGLLASWWPVASWPPGGPPQPVRVPEQAGPGGSLLARRYTGVRILLGLDAAQAAPSAPRLLYCCPDIYSPQLLLRPCLPVPAPCPVTASYRAPVPRYTVLRYSTSHVRL